MDGMLLVAFFFPLLVSFNLALSIVTFSLSLFASFGPEIVHAMREMLKANDWTSDYADTATGWLVRIVGTVDEKQPLSLFWPLLVSGVTAWTTLSTYGVGGAMQHGKRGWKFIQPGRGGIRFVFVQIFTWITFAISVAMPWTTIKDIGWLTVLGIVPDKEKDPTSHRGLLVVGSAFGMLANTFVILGLMSFDPKEKLVDNLKEQRQNLDTGRWRWNLFGDSEAWWWLFLMLQGTLVVFSWQLAVMLEMSSAARNNIVEALLLMVVNALLAVPVSLTNAIAGKWRHGERAYRLTMPFQGGAVFVALQGLGWALFGLSFIATLTKLYSTATASDTKISISSTASLGFISYLCIVASLFVFDPSKVREPVPPSIARVQQVSSEEEEEAVVRKPKQRASGRGSKGRSMSPPLNRPLLEEADQVPEEDDDDEGEGEEEDEGEDDEEDEDAELSHGTTDQESETVWEEMEDEKGNVFYFNTVTRQTSISIPTGYLRALASPRLASSS